MINEQFSKLQELLNNIITSSVKTAVSEDVKEAVSEYILENGSEFLDRFDIITSDNLSDHLDYDDIATSIQDDIQNEVLSTIDGDKIASNLLDSYNPMNSCSTGTLYYNSIVESIKYDLMCHSIKPESVRDHHYKYGDTSIFDQLTRVVKEIVDDRLQKVELVKTFDKTTAVEIIDDVVPSTAFPCTHFKITTYTPEQSEAIKAFLFSNKQMQESRVQFTTKTDTPENPL
jgi:hypothetical protein